MRRGAIALALALTAGVMTPATATSEPAIRVAVATDRAFYSDTTETATYAVTCPRGAGPCPAPRADRSVDVRRHTVARPRLGLDAVRSRVEVERADLSGTGLQEESIAIEVIEAGALDVTMSGTKNSDADAAPVAGTASAGGRVSGRAVHWHVASAGPGKYTFRAQFRVTADRTKVGTYAPRTVVERSARTATLLDHAWGRQPAGRSLLRVSAVTFAARVAPPYGPPRGHTQPWVTGRDRAGLADVFQSQAALDAYGTYSATASGVVGVTTRFDLTTLRPRVPRDIGASMTMSWAGELVEEKFVPEGSFAYADGGLGGFGLSLCTVPAPGDSIAPTAGSVLYDGDAATVSATAAVFDNTMQRQGPPQNDRGRIRPDWSGYLTSGWSAWSLRSALDREGPTLDRWFAYGASIGWVVTGGDVDNKDGNAPVRSAPAVVHVPPGEVVSGAFMSMSWSSDQEFGADWDVKPTSIAVRAQVDPGSYWLRSTRKGYERDWALHTMLNVQTRPAGNSAGAPASFASLQLVPAGMRTQVQYAAGGETRRAVLEPGAWLVTATRGALHVAQVSARSAGAADDCARLVV